ncbi:uncharacterized protein LOC110239738 [Exaiptasia diaphana]|uniref:Uncharacterized protein n=1 Tax=Exaiptasia diaphana TaxID=2652724 RepID=A0A913XAV1_EXADI|nr:uncharacterized protein LOC110239738 [Exaiptasia diaphana]XP_020901138.1 uncharacterized protein LOC110239738 [Exaiptasia diaphana]KXJ13849.1 hypothetical protein AC249_AIPGENE4930 [Exaiptasia diaphana]
MGCSAGKTLSTSPEISTSTQHTNIHGINAKIDNKNGLSNNGLVDEKRPSQTLSSSKSSVNPTSRRDSTDSGNSSNSLDTPEKCLDALPDNKHTKQKQTQEQSKHKVENGGQPRKPLLSKNRGENEQQQVRSIPLGQVKVQLTQSQADFFTMLDRKIEEGEDYKSDCER